MTNAKKVVENLKYHVVDSTALLTLSHPFFTAFETMIAGMSTDISMNTRLYITGLTYLGLGYLTGKGRDFSRKTFNITDKTKERIQFIHDSVYLAAINLPISAGLYFAAGETDLEKIAIGTGMGIAFGAVMGPGVGYVIDAYRDLTGLKKCERWAYPKAIRNLNSKIKKGLAIALTAVSIGLMGLVYSLSPDAKIEMPAIEQKAESLEKLTQELHSDK